MIGPRVVLTAAVTVALVIVGFGAGAPNPERALNADRLVLERANDADLALASVQDALAEALETARQGAAAVVAGEDPPGPRFADASAQLVGAASAADDASASVARLEAARRADAADVDPFPVGVDGAELLLIAEQLDGVVAAADTSAEMRRRASNVPVALDAALAAVQDRDLDLAEQQLDIARADHGAVAGWDVDFITLPIWVETTDRSIAIVERLVGALRAGDVSAAEAAAAELAAFGDDAGRADRALQIAVSEGGGTMAAGPLAGLSAAKRSIDDQRAAVGDVLVATRSGER